MRMLLLHHEGAPMLASVTAGPLYKRILDWPTDDAELFAVWSVPTDDSHAIATDITEQFAKTWAMEFVFGDGLEASEYLSPFPAFIRLAVSDHLTTKWQSWMASRDENFIPNPLRLRA